MANKGSDREPEKLRKIEIWPISPDTFSDKDAIQIVDDLFLSQYRRQVFSLYRELDASCANAKTEEKVAEEVNRLIPKLRQNSDKIIRSFGVGYPNLLDLFDRRYPRDEPRDVFGDASLGDGFDNEMVNKEIVEKIIIAFPNLARLYRMWKDAFQPLMKRSSAEEISDSGGKEYIVAFDQFYRARQAHSDHPSPETLRLLHKHRDEFLSKHLMIDVARFLGYVPLRIDLEHPAFASKSDAERRVFTDLAVDEAKAEQLGERYGETLAKKSRTWLTSRTRDICEQLEAVDNDFMGYFDPKLLIELDNEMRRNRRVFVLVGEIGSGKEYLAKMFHMLGKVQSQTNTGKFVPINCAAIPDELAESTLFGHMKGSFTGAGKDQVGAFERAEGGTLFLDEFGELSKKAIATLLRTLANYREGFEIQPVGGETQRVDLKLILATTPESWKKMRADIKSRVQRHHSLTSLREWPPAAVEKFIRWHATYYSEGLWRCPERPLSLETVKGLIEAHPKKWDNNLRELVTFLEFSYDYFGGGLLDDSLIQLWHNTMTGLGSTKSESDPRRAPFAVQKAAAILARHLLAQRDAREQTVPSTSPDGKAESFDELEKDLRAEVVLAIARKLRAEGPPIKQEELGEILGFKANKISKWLKALEKNWREITEEFWGTQS